MNVRTRRTGRTATNRTTQLHDREGRFVIGERAEQGLDSLTAVMQS